MNVEQVESASVCFFFGVAKNTFDFCLTFTLLCKSWQNVSIFKQQQNWTHMKKNKIAKCKIQKKKYVIIHTHGCMYVGT